MEGLKELIEAELLPEGLRVDTIELIKEGSVNYLRITVDRGEPVDLEACVKATHVINKILDEKDPIKEKYILEVCSKRKGGS